MAFQYSEEELPSRRLIGRVLYEPRDVESAEITFLENDRGDGWDAYFCQYDLCSHVLDDKGEISDERAIALASMILYEAGVNDIPFLKLERDDTVTYAIAPPWSRHPKEQDE